MGWHALGPQFQEITPLTPVVPDHMDSEVPVARRGRSQKMKNWERVRKTQPFKANVHGFGMKGSAN